MNITIPSSFLSSVASSSTTMIANLGGVTYVIIGLFLAFFVLELVIGLFRKADEE